MQILKKGEAHKALVMYFTCDFCGSKLKSIEGDPRVEYNWDSYNKDGGYKIKTKCPVCNMIIKTKTTKYNVDEMLTMVDKEEMNSWEDDELTDLTDDELTEIGTIECEEIYRKRHPNVTLI